MKFIQRFVIWKDHMRTPTNFEPMLNVRNTKLL